MAAGQATQLARKTAKNTQVSGLEPFWKIRRHGVRRDVKSTYTSDEPGPRRRGPAAHARLQLALGREARKVAPCMMNIASPSRPTSRA